MRQHENLKLSFPKDLLHPGIPQERGDGASLGSLGECFARGGEGFTFPVPLFLAKDRCSLARCLESCPCNVLRESHGASLQLRLRPAPELGG